MNMEPLRVGKNTEVKNLANAIMAQVRQYGICFMVAIGAGAINQAIKAWASANGLANSEGIVLTGTPFFHEVTLDTKGSPNTSEKKTAILFYINALSTFGTDVFLEDTEEEV